MKPIELETRCRKMLSDIYTPVGIYLRVRDRFRDTILLESADYHAAENSYSIIAINAIGGIEVTSPDSADIKYPGRKAERTAIKSPSDVPSMIWDYMQRYVIQGKGLPQASMAQGLFGYSSYDAVQFFEGISLAGKDGREAIPLMRYRLYQYVIIVNHFRDEMYLCENVVAGVESEIAAVETLIKSKDVPVFPFSACGGEDSDMLDRTYLDIVNKGIASCHRGDVFQIVLSRRFRQAFQGDEFNVYRTLRSINPSPYLFYFDYGDYKLMGSSPESQLIIRNGRAVVHPIAGTFKRTGDDRQDAELAAKLLADAKENAEHTMLVDLARNDLSRVCHNVRVEHYREVQHYSHVIHLVSEVSGETPEGLNPFLLLAATFPAGTLSGAPKYRAMELIRDYEPSPRGYYGGCIGFMGFDGSCNHAIMIRTFMSSNNTLVYQAGAGVVAASVPQGELEEVNNKLNALRQAIRLAEEI